MQMATPTSQRAPDSQFQTLVVGGADRRKELDEARRIFATAASKADLAETTGPGDAPKSLFVPATRAANSSSPAAAWYAQRSRQRPRSPANGHRVPLALLPGGTATFSPRN